MSYFIFIILCNIPEKKCILTNLRQCQRVVFLIKKIYLKHNELQKCFLLPPIFSDFLAILLWNTSIAFHIITLWTLYDHCIKFLGAND